MGNPEQDARRQIDQLLVQAGWHVCAIDQANIMAYLGVAIREFPLPRHGFADYLLYIDGRAAGVIAAKKAGVTLSGVEIQSAKYTKGLPDGLPRWRNPLPFAYQSSGAETRFTHGLNPDPRSRAVFAFHTLKKFQQYASPYKASRQTRSLKAASPSSMSSACASRTKMLPAKTSEVCVGEVA